MKLMLYPLPTPTMKKDAKRRTSGADESIPEKRMRSPLFPNFYIGNCHFMKFGNNSDRRNDTYAERHTGALTEASHRSLRP